MKITESQLKNYIHKAVLNEISLESGISDFDRAAPHKSKLIDLIENGEVNVKEVATNLVRMISDRQAEEFISMYSLPGFDDEDEEDYDYNEIDESAIHIKKKNKGKFTKTKKETGKSTEELTHSKNPLTKKRAIFAQNAKKWNHKKKKGLDEELTPDIDGTEFDFGDRGGKTLLVRTDDEENFTTFAESIVGKYIEDYKEVGDGEYEMYCNDEMAAEKVYDALKSEGIDVEMK